MRSKLLIISAAVLVWAAPSAARAQGARTSVQGFGGLTFGTSSVLGGTATASTFGGRITGELTPNIQVIGEGGRLTDIKPPLLDLLDLTPIDLRLSAWYGEAGVRFLAGSRHAAVRPYVEATAGMARLNTSVSGFGGRADTVIDTGLGFLNRTEPLLGAGGGVQFQGGPLTVDAGYRYKKIMAGGVASTLNGGNDFQVHQVRIGLGVRF